MTISGLAALAGTIGPGGSAVRGCRVVTASMSARLLLAEQLEAMSEIEWTVVSGDEWAEPTRGVVAEHVRMRRELALSDPASLVALYRLFRARRFSFVQTHTPKASMLGLPAARLAGTLPIYTVHGSLYFKGNGRLANVAGWIFERWCCSWATRVLLQSREDCDALPRARICSAAKLRYLGNGIRLDRFAPAPPPSPAERPTVLMISRLVAEKGCRDFIALARALRHEARFVHVGPQEDDQRDGLTKEEISGAAADGVEFVGAVADVRPQILRADVVVLPSYREGIPRAAMEAAAMGRPVVAYDVRGVREVIPPDTDLLVGRGDLPALIRRVSDLLSDPQARSALGKRCSDHVSRFSEEAVISRLQAVYVELGLL